MSETNTVIMPPEPTSDGSALMRVIAKLAEFPDFDVNKVRELYQMKKEYEADEARKAFVVAMSAFKGNSIRVIKDKTNPQFASRYVSLGNLVSTVTPYLSEQGLSVRWDIDQTAGIKVTCVITHKQGHAESVTMTVPPDKSGAKNPIQEIKSAITYAKACTFESICGLASTEANADDDGNGAGGKECLPEQTVQEYIDAMRDCSTIEALKQLYFDAYKKAEKLKDQAAMRTFVQVSNQCKVRFQKEGAK